MNILIIILRHQIHIILNSQGNNEMYVKFEANWLSLTNQFTAMKSEMKYREWMSKYERATS